MSEIATTTVPGTLAPATEAPSLLNIIAMAAENPNVDVTKLQALLDMQKQVLATQAEAAFNKALGRVSASMPRVPKNGRVQLGQGKGGYDFAKWEDMDHLIRPLLRQEGFTLSFDTVRDDGIMFVVGILLHADGHSQSRRVPLPPDNGAGRNPLQAVGSTLSYGKRYTTEMLLNIVREGADDDGQAGGAEYITVAQANGLSAELDSLQGDPEQFLAFMNAASFQDIRKADFAKASNALAAKRRKQGGGQ